MVMRCRKSHKGTPPPLWGTPYRDTVLAFAHAASHICHSPPFCNNRWKGCRWARQNIVNPPPPLSPAHQLTSIFDGLFATVLINYHLYFRWTL